MNSTISDSFGNWRLETSLPVSYTIKNSPGIFNKTNRDLFEHGTFPGRRLVIIDDEVHRLYKDQIFDFFEYNKVAAHYISLDCSESKKDFETLLFLLKEIEQFGLLRRSEPLIAIGGGVLMDIVGLAASLYRRGVPYIRVPTTLIGLVDASVGAKTGINFLDRRNRLGAYYPPKAAYLDKSFLKTLQPIDISSGLGEILKMGVVGDYDLFQLLEEYGSALFASKFSKIPEIADRVINLATQGMKDELQGNLWENDLERYVDFGHSFSPIIEMRSIDEPNWKSLTHGHAVAIDVVFSCIISHQRGMMDGSQLDRVIRTSDSMKIPVWHELFLEPTVVLEALQDTTRHRNGNQNLPIPIEVGKSEFVNDLKYEEIRDACRMMKDISQKYEQ